MRAPTTKRHRRPPQAGPTGRRPETKGGGTLPPWHASGEEETPR